MASTIPDASAPGQPGAVPGPAAPEPAAPMMQNTQLQQSVYQMPASQTPHTQSPRPVPGIERLSIALIFIAGLLVILGSIATWLKAYAAKVSNPTWTGLLVSSCKGTP